MIACLNRTNKIDQWQLAFKNALAYNHIPPGFRAMRHAPLMQAARQQLQVVLIGNPDGAMKGMGS